MIESLFKLFHSAEDYTALKEIINDYDQEVIIKFKKLLEDIKEKDLEVQFAWGDINKVRSARKTFDAGRSYNVLNNLAKLEYKTPTQLETMGRFTMVNLRTGAYEFKNMNGTIVSSGKLSRIVNDITGYISFSSVYEIKVARTTEKKTGKHKPHVKDTITFLKRLATDVDPNQQEGSLFVE